MRSSAQGKGAALDQEAAQRRAGDEYLTIEMVP